jgi:hypothetical protein
MYLIYRLNRERKEEDKGKEKTGVKEVADTKERSPN